MPLIVIRYAIAALILTTTAVALAVWLLVSLHSWLFALAGFEPTSLQRTALDPYSFELAWHQAHLARR